MRCEGPTRWASPGQVVFRDLRPLGQSPLVAVPRHGRGGCALPMTRGALGPGKLTTWSLLTEFVHRRTQSLRTPASHALLSPQHALQTRGAFFLVPESPVILGPRGPAKPAPGLTK